MSRLFGRTEVEGKFGGTGAGFGGVFEAEFGGQRGEDAGGVDIGFQNVGVGSGVTGVDGSQKAGYRELRADAVSAGIWRHRKH